MLNTVDASVVDAANLGRIGHGARSASAALLTTSAANTTAVSIVSAVTTSKIADLNKNRKESWHKNV